MQTRLPTIAASLILTSSSLDATEIFRWVDDDGVVHYSDTAPVSAGASLSTVSKLVVIADNAPDYRPGENEYSILSQAERINARLEKIRAEREAQQEKNREQHVARPRSSDSSQRYDGVYRRSYFYAPLRQHRQDTFERPGLRRAQLQTLDRLGIDHSKRPHSINSSAHLNRIKAGAALLDPPSAKPAH